jgi:hypothetical protein
MKTTDDDAMWQFWIRREGTMALLNDDLQKGSFDVPAEFARNNAEALVSE